MDQKLVQGMNQSFLPKKDIISRSLLTLFTACICLCIQYKTGRGQDVIQLPIEVDKIKKEIIIPYHLRNPRKKNFKYEVQLYYSQNGGKDFEGPLKMVSGAVGKDLLASENREIRWTYLAEKPNFNGKNVLFALDIKGERLLGGPENALLSALVPGLGNPFVSARDKFSWRWTLTTLSTYALIGNSFIFKNRSRQNYNDYQRLLEVDAVQKAYRVANRQNNIATISAVLAGLLWATDIVHVAIKGKKNVLEQNKLKQLPQNQGIMTRISIQVDPYSGSPAFGLKILFP